LAPKTITSAPVSRSVSPHKRAETRLSIQIPGSFN
jgi:hypothetical protein